MSVTTFSDDDLERAAIAARAIAAQHEEHSNRAPGSLREHFVERSQRYRALAQRFDHAIVAVGFRRVAFEEVFDLVDGAAHRHNVLDLVQHYPRRCVDRTKKAEIAELSMGEEATVFAEVRSVHGRRTRQRRTLVEVVVSDGTSLLNVTFFNQPWREKQLTPGTDAAFFGKLDLYRGKRQMTNPIVDVIGRGGADDKTGVIVPVYPQSGKAEVFTWQLRGLVADALSRCAARGFADPLDEATLDRYDLVDRNTALRAIHRPDSTSPVC